MHTLTFYPLGNADTNLIELSNGRILVIDYAHVKSAAEGDRRYDLKTDLTAKLDAKKRTDVDVFCITHLDWDHIAKAHEFFYLEHAAKYQTGKRFKIVELWVPASAITEEGCEDEARIWRAEAQHRLKQGAGIRIFSKPDLLKDWMAKNDVDFESRKHLITDAGSLVSGFSLAADEAEFFLHSPHGHVINQRDAIDRNKDCVVLQAVFEVQGQQTKVIYSADAHWETMVDIVTITKRHGNESRLDYDIFSLPHHCSAYSLNAEKGVTKTVPEPEITEWFDRGSTRCILISSSDIIPTTDSTQPPHIQAKRYYEDVKLSKNGQFKVTMEHPNTFYDPSPLVVEVGRHGGVIKTIASEVGSAATVAVQPPKAG
jgi:hypothetical protein